MSRLINRDLKTKKEQRIYGIRQKKIGCGKKIPQPI